MLQVAAAQELSGCYLPFTLRLHFEQFDRRCVTATCEHPGSRDDQFARRGCLVWCRLHKAHDELFAAHRRIRPGPGLKPAPTVVDILCSACEVDETVFAFQYRGMRRVGGALL